MGLIQDIYSLFPDAKPQDNYMRVRCPYHSNGQERHPSMSIITNKHNGLDPGFCQCFACGWKGTFAEIAADFGLQWVPDENEVVTSEDSQNPISPVDLAQAVYKKDVPYSYSPYLAKRGISEAVQQQYRTYERADQHKVYMPVFSKEGKFLYANARSTIDKKFFIPKGTTKALAGVEELDFTKPIGIVEAQISAMTLATARYVRAVALLGASNVSALSVIRNAPGPFLLMLDNDLAGRKALTKVLNLLGDYRCRVFRFPEGKDPNDIWQDVGFDSAEFISAVDSFEISVELARKQYCL